MMKVAELAEVAGEAALSVTATKPRSGSEPSLLRLLSCTRWFSLPELN